MGGLAGLNAARGLANLPLVTPPPTTAHGALLNYITTTEPGHFQPINTNFGLFPPLTTRVHDKEQKRNAIAQRALEDFDGWRKTSGLS
jgi:methylenetetrahydrofolate--tRNA-(uracil-5-)-methyltransferase